LCGGQAGGQTAPLSKKRLDSILFGLTAGVVVLIFSTVRLQTRRGLFLRLLRPSVPTPALHLNGAPSTVRLAGVFLLLIEVVLIRVL